MQKVFQLSLTFLVSLASIILAFAEGGPLPALTIPIALATYYFVDRAKLLRLPDIAVTLLGIGAFLAAGTEFFTAAQEMDTPDGVTAAVIAGGHLIIYLTWAFLLQQKTHRHSWWIFALSVLQVSIASVLTDSIFFGIGLVLFMFLAVWTMSTFLLYRSTPSEKPVGEISPSEEGAFAGPGECWNGLSLDVRESLISFRFVRNSLVVTCLSLLLSAGFFLYTPRPWQDASASMASTLATLTGFTKEVRLGDIGEILESNDSVMSIRLFRSPDRSLLSEEQYRAFLGAEPLFRGAVLERYENGRWQTSSMEPFENKPARPARRDKVEGLVIQQVTLQPIGAETLFAHGNLISAVPLGWERDEILRNYFSDELLRDSRSHLNQEYRYEVLSDYRGFDAAPRQERLEWQRGSLIRLPEDLKTLRFLFDEYLRELKQFPAGLSQLRAVTREVVDDITIDEAKAFKILHWLRDSGEFSYTLVRDRSDRSIDPLEDFLLNRKSGHCEYFASAMVMMLRAEGIPARMVSGFKGGIYSERHRVFHVQQLHAHAWVEAYLGDRWRVFDPTPARRNEQVADLQTTPPIWETWWSNAKSNWVTALRLSKDGQQEMLFEPLWNAFRSLYESAKQLLQGNTASLRHAIEFLKQPDQWFSWKGGLAAMLIVSVLWILRWIMIRVWRLANQVAKAVSSRGTTQERRLQKVAFYERFLGILRKHGIAPAPTQTAREFVTQSLADLEPKLASHGMRSWPDELVEDFYRVRFGHETLDAATTAELTHRLDELESCLNQRETDPS